jgi:hypothetical protein
MLYGAHSKINHTQRMMLMPLSAMDEVDSILEGMARKI